jgi:hypothetical protein
MAALLFPHVISTILIDPCTYTSILQVLIEAVVLVTDPGLPQMSTDMNLQVAIMIEETVKTPGLVNVVRHLVLPTSIDTFQGRTMAHPQ